MEERLKDRFKKKLLIKVDDRPCVMEDMSGIGMKLITPFLLKKKKVDITFQMENLELDLKGTIRWIRKEPTVYDQVQYQVGISLIDPPDEYIQLVQTLLQE